MSLNTPIIKLGEAVTLTANDIKSTDSVLLNPDVLARMSDDAFIARFKKVSADLKTIAPKAKDFLYFSAVMMHAAEHCLLGEDGALKKDANGLDLTSSWEKEGDSWKWTCSDPTIKPYKNSNNDIFPEEELIRAHKLWIGRPLCLDHQSDSVDKIRGVIVDTYYDYPLKRIVALCALDKKNYPDLARKIETGYATCVSMGTAVGKAICTDCGNVARVEADFCNHMRSKSCYGEINTELKPIELSIVVNGADGKATIRHIIASADSIAKYVSMKEDELSKMADMHEMPRPEQVDEVINGLKEQLDKLSELKSVVQKALDYEKKEESGEMPGEYQEETPEEKEASVKDQLTKLAGVVSGIDSKLHRLVEDVTKLSKNNSEDTMAKKIAYFQGGGGLNEPTPGKPRYPVEDYVKVRDKEDKQMVGQGVDGKGTGPVDGIHPGYDSFGETEEARKKRLQRTAQERAERQLRRKAALQAAKDKLEKASYFQGGGGLNEPTPGKPKYPVEDYAKIRDKEDKQMVGQPPFPDVGAVDGLHPSPASADEKDELKRKQMLARAKLKANFVKAATSSGSEDPANSRWSVYAGNDQDGWKLVLTATVDEITNGNTERLYGSVATKEFGDNLLRKIRSEGFDQVRALYKKAQSAMPGGEAAPPMGEAAPPMGGAEEGLAEMPDEGKAGDPADQLMAALTEIENGAADARAAAEALTEEGGELEEGPGLTAETSQLIEMQNKLGKGLAVSFNEAAQTFNTHKKELTAAYTVAANRDKLSDVDAAFIDQVVAEACEDAAYSLASFATLRQAFVKYARGTEALEARAKTEKELAKTAQDPTVPAEEADPGDPLAGLPEDVVVPEADPAPAVPKTNPLENPLYRQVMSRLDKDKSLTIHRLTDDEFKALRAGAMYKSRMNPDSLTQVELHALRPSRSAGSTYNPAEGTIGQQPMVPEDVGNADSYAADVSIDPEGNISLKNVPDSALQQFASKAGEDNATIKVAEEEIKTKAAEKEVDLTTAEGRAAYREKLAQKGLAFSDMLQKAHPQGGVTTQLDTKPTGDLAKVETLPEAHQAMMDVATAPPNVRKLAAEIQEMVTSGRIDPTKDFSDLVAMGLDSDAIKYWKAYWGEAKDGGSQFASDLIKEHAKKKAEKEQDKFRTKLSRSYELAYAMQRRGMIPDERTALNQQVDEIMSWNDEGFDSMKRLVAKYEPTVKTAMPHVGMMGTNEVTIPAPEAAPTNLKNALDSAFANRKY